MAAHYRATPSDTLFRIGRAPNALAWAPWEKVGAGRYDDPRSSSLRQYRVLYAGTRRACFYESLADFRPDIDGVVKTSLTQNWIDRRQLAAFTIRDRPGSQCGWLDIQEPMALHRLKEDLGEVFSQHGLTDFDISAATSERLEITQEIGLWAYEQGFSGIAYPSRLAPRMECWALFENRPWEISTSQLIPLDWSDPDLQAVINVWNLTTPPETDRDMAQGEVTPAPHRSPSVRPPSTAAPGGCR